MKKLKNKLLNFIKKILSPYGKTSFLDSLKHDCKILDVGCGNDSPKKIKSIIPNCNYVGIDIENYNQGSTNFADKYILTSSENFAKEIYKFQLQFDAVISSHNLEHCLNWRDVFMAMFMSLKVDGKIYVSFPAEKSIHFPSRRGTLNFYDDPTHKNLIIFDEFIDLLKSIDCEVIYKTKNYRPFLLVVLGFILEPISKYKNYVLPGTWAYYGFEQIFIIKKIN